MKTSISTGYLVRLIYLSVERESPSISGGGDRRAWVLSIETEELLAGSQPSVERAWEQRKGAEKDP